MEIKDGPPPPPPQRLFPSRHCVGSAFKIWNFVGHYSLPGSGSETLHPGTPNYILYSQYLGNVPARQGAQIRKEASQLRIWIECISNLWTNFCDLPWRTAAPEDRLFSEIFEVDNILGLFWTLWSSTKGLPWPGFTLITLHAYKQNKLCTVLSPDNCGTRRNVVP